MKRKGLLDIEPADVPEESETIADVICRAQVVYFEGIDILNIDLFRNGALRARYFADKKDWTVWIDGSWRKMKLINAARAAAGREAYKGCYWMTGGEYEFAFKKEEKAAKDYLERYSIDAFENDVNWRKSIQRAQRKADRIEKMMTELVDFVTPEQEDWIKREVFPGNYLFAEEKGNRTYYSCTACGAESWTKKKLKHGAKTTCPKCGAQVKVEKKTAQRSKASNVTLLQTAGDQWIMRLFRAECCWEQAEKKLNMYENIRLIAPKGTALGKVWYGEERNADEFEQTWWDKNRRSQRFTRSYLYTDNLDEVLPVIGIKAGGVKELAAAGKFNVDKALVAMETKGYLEYLIKAGLVKMTEEIIDVFGLWAHDPGEFNYAGKSLSEFLRLDGNRTNRLKRLNGGRNMRTWLRNEEVTGMKARDEDLIYLEKSKIEPKECADLLKLIGSVPKVVNYLKKQKGKVPYQTLLMWKDYLKMAEEEGLDTADAIVNRPKELKKRHDELVEIRNARKDAEKLAADRKKYTALNRKIREQLQGMREYFWETEKYMIIPAGTCEELMEEGRKLHHCVGASDAYMEKMAEGRTWILFMRKKEELEKPYYTIEIRLNDDMIMQAYSEFDRKPDWEEIRKELDRYKEHLRRGRLKEEIKITA